MRRIPWYESVKLILLGIAVGIAWLLYRRLSDTADRVDAATPGLQKASSGIGSLSQTISDLLGGKS